MRALHGLTTLRSAGLLAGALAGALVLGACSDEKTSPNEGDGEHFFRAEISGGYTGTLNATSKDLDKLPELRQEVAIGALAQESGMTALLLTGHQLAWPDVRRGEGRQIVLLVLDPKVGTYSGDDICAVDFEFDTDDIPGLLLSGCRVAALFQATDGEFDWQAALTSGTLKITRLDDDRVAGTFEFKGTSRVRPLFWQSMPDDVGDGWADGGQINVTKGRYDLELADDLDFGGLFGAG